ncbi:MAG: CHAT domain-containing protein [Chloroflexota bacterium]
MLKNTGSSRSTKEAIPFDELFEQLLFDIYTHWYEYPLKSTQQRFLTVIAPAFAESLLNTQNSDELQANILAFIEALKGLPRVEDLVGGHLQQIEARLGSGNPGKSLLLKSTPEPISISAEKRALILTALQAAHPVQWLLAQLPYETTKVNVTGTWTNVLAAIDAVAGRLPDDVRRQVTTIRQEIGEPASSEEEAKKGLDQLAEIPLIVQIAIGAYLQGKVLPKPKKEKPKRSVDASVLQSKSPTSTTMRGPTSKTPTDGSTSQSFYTDVQFPGSVAQRENHVLRVQLTLKQREQSVVQGNRVNIAFTSPEPELVEVVVSTAGFEEVTNNWSRSMLVYPDQDSQPALFLLKAVGERGKQHISINFYHKGRNVGSATFETEISTKTSSTRTAKTVDGKSLEIPMFLENPPPPADLELRITKASNGNILSFLLHSTNAKVGYHWMPVGEIELVAENPRAFLEHKFERMSQLAAKNSNRVTEEQAKAFVREVETVGEELFEELIPEKLRTEYWRRIKPLREEGVIKSLLITSDEPWIPWELIRPYQYDQFTGEETNDGFLAEKFEFCRWLAGQGPAGEVEVENARIIVPKLDLKYVQNEKNYFDALPNSGVDIDPPLQTVQEVKDFARNGGVRLVHLAAHGDFDVKNPNQSRLVLQDGSIVPDDLVGSGLKGWRNDKPIIFLNACHTSQIGYTLTGMGGWAEKFVSEVGVSAFIGSLWEVNDLLASEFAIEFYNHLLAGKTLGKAFHLARLYIFKEQPANPTWLAYTLYGDPNSRVKMGNVQASNTIQTIKKERDTAIEEDEPVARGLNLFSDSDAAIEGDEPVAHGLNLFFADDVISSAEPTTDSDDVAVQVETQVAAQVEEIKRALKDSLSKQLTVMIDEALDIQTKVSV